MTVSSTFNAADGDGYEMQMGRWSRRLVEPFLDFVGTADDERVLDVGCGTGCLAGALLQRCQPKEVRGIDFSPAYVAYAARNNHDERVSYEVGDACKLAFPSGSFYRVVPLLLLHFVPPTSDALAEMRRVARRGAGVATPVRDELVGIVANRSFF